MVEIGGSTQKTILDPSLAPSGPVPLTQWISLSNPQGSYLLEWTLGSVYYSDTSVQRNDQTDPVIQSFAELTPFQAEDISAACGTMHNYLVREGTAATAQKQKLLLGRTRTLANRLLGVGKLSGYSAGGFIRCGPTLVPLCREPAQSCTTDDDCCSLLCNAGTCRARPVDQSLDGGTASGTDGGTSGSDAGVVPDGGTTPDAGVPANELMNGVPMSNLSGAAGSQVHYRLSVPAGASGLKFQLSGSSGDADLYVRYGAEPTTTLYDHRPYLAGSNEVVTPSVTQAGTWYVMVRGYSGYSGVSLEASFTP
jgi:hypothetical protein